jgi:hypothetical protein
VVKILFIQLIVTFHFYWCDCNNEFIQHISWRRRRRRRRRRKMENTEFCVCFVLQLLMRETLPF